MLRPTPQGRLVLNSVIEILAASLAPTGSLAA